MVDLYPQGRLGLGTLSWRGANALGPALQSYADHDMYSLFDDRLIVLPDAEEAVLDIAKLHPYRVETPPQNLGILGGMEAVVKGLDTRFVLLTENDCPLIESRAECQRQIEIGLELLHSGQAKMVRLRHRQYFGQKFDTIDKYNKLYPNPDTVSAKFKRLLRPAKAVRLSGTAIYAEGAPAQKFPDYIDDIGDGFYLVDAFVMPWTNQSILLERSFFLDHIVPFCRSRPIQRGVNGFHTVEVELNNTKFWRDSGWKIACGPGLFTHERL